MCLLFSSMVHGLKIRLSVYNVVCVCVCAPAQFGGDSKRRVKWSLKTKGEIGMTPRYLTAMANAVLATGIFAQPTSRCRPTNGVLATTEKAFANLDAGSER